MSITYPGGDLLIIGSGGREHALAWSLSQSQLLPNGTTIYVAPGNGGTATMRHPKIKIENVNITAIDEIIQFATTHKIGLVVVGPEDPLAEGITDKLKAVGITCFGPSAAAARLESSKVYAKEFMMKYNIPTARYRSFNKFEDAKTYLESIDFPVVVKASGLAAGKGVMMPSNTAEAIAACHTCLIEQAFGSAGNEIVIEEYLDGWEASVLAFSDGVTVIPMPAAQDHKRVYEFNKGLNTGGMGAFCPSRRVTAETMSTVVRTILQPAIDGMRAEGTPFVGILFAGLMIGNGTKDQTPRTLEFNVRFGDPETQVVLPLLKTDLLSIMMACVNGKLHQVHVEFAIHKFAATIVAASEGYPQVYPKGRVITGTSVANELPMTTVFHAGTTLNADKSLVTSGGRVLAVTGVGNSMSQAIDAAYNGIEKITFQGMFYRKDIGGAYRRPLPSQPLRIGILGSTRGTDMTAIIDAINSKRLHARIEIVISNVADAGILEKARNANLKCEHIPSKGKTREAFDAEVVRSLHAHNVDLVLLIGFMRILSPIIIQRYAWRVLNVHPSLLPDFAGGMDLNVHDAVIKAGRKESGCTIHFIDDGPVDHGPHLIQKRCTIDANETADTLKTKVQHLEGLAFIEAIEMFYDHQYLLTTILRQGFGGQRQTLYRMYRKPMLSKTQQQSLIERMNHTLLTNGSHTRITHINTEYCYYIDFDDHLHWSDLDGRQQNTLKWLLCETFEPDYLGKESFLSSDEKSSSSIIEVGPSLSFTSAWSTNAVSICHNVNLAIRRLERYRRYQLVSTQAMTEHETELFTEMVVDRMTEYRVKEPLITFESSVKPKPWVHIPIMEQGISALQHYNKEMGLAFDDWDQHFYFDLYSKELKRNPTNVELFDISQSNSEHSRHWFFKGDLVIDGTLVPHSLMSLVTDTLTAHSENSIIAFADNSSVIRGYRIPVLEPENPGQSSSLTLSQRYRHLLLTAETHNFPCGVAPYPGAETGTGGRLRDTHATGRGSLVAAGIAAYCVGNLHIPGYVLPWEDMTFKYPSNLATPLTIEIQASNGASDYGNKFGEPVVVGFTRSYGQRTCYGERREYVKPIMFSAGIGFLDDQHKVKGKPEKDMLVVKLGGPAYRIGIGGSAASSMVQGENKASLDFNAVQRGDAEMEQKMNRVIRACIELGEKNPIISIHDQGAGGNCNVLKEIVDPAGGRINIRAVKSGDATLSVLELWGAEYQESDALLIQPESKDLFTSICTRERAPVAYVGVVTGDGHVIVYDEQDNSTPVDMDLKTVLGSMPKKTFKLDHIKHTLTDVSIPSNITLQDILDRLLRLLSIGSKRFLTNKVDRAVTGLVAQQQCVGPLHIPLSNYAIIASSHHSYSGVVSAVGEQPIKGLINPSAMARLTVGESLTNIVFAKLTDLTHIKCSANWMWAPKLPGEGAIMYDAVKTMRDVMIELGVAVDGGKDSLSMAAVCPVDEHKTEVVKAPGTLVVSLYCSMDDIRVKVTPDLKHAGNSTLIHIDMSGRPTSQLPHLGGTSFAQVYNQLGNTTSDMYNITYFKKIFVLIQNLLTTKYISAGHDISDGGLLTTILEMAFTGNVGVKLEIHGDGHALYHTMFAEELGVVIEVKNEHVSYIKDLFTKEHVTYQILGTTTNDKDVTISYNNKNVLTNKMTTLRDIWEETSFQLEKLQANPECVIQEQQGLASRIAPPLTLTYDPQPTSTEILTSTNKPRIAILREEGSNGDREMSAAFYLAGFDVVDVAMSDIVAGNVHIDDGSFRGIAFVGGFSYADVMDSAKGWAGVIRHNTSVWEQFQNFYRRTDTFSLGICNGCQLMALLGWIPYPSTNNNTDAPVARFIHNKSERFESRYVTVRIEPSNSILLKGMEGSSVGCWLQHGEGQAFFTNPEVLKRVIDEHLAPIRYVDDNNHVTEQYPFNPNGSPLGIASLISTNGRHLAMMPHPERCFLPWQMPWLPQEEKWQAAQVSPWMRLFQNARTWCDQTPKMTPQQTTISAHIHNTLNETYLPLGIRRSGKVRDSYETETEIILITTDRLSAFDRILASIPFKGQVLNMVSAWWFQQTKHIIPNHIISIPHPNVTVAKKCKPFAIEFVCRAYVTGTTSTSLWTHYSKGVRNYCGNVIPDGLVKNQKLPHAIITPTTKADDHDVPISPDEIIAQGYMTKEDWEYTSKAALAIFELGMKLAAQHGLLLIDTKYEFGKDMNGVITLIDEIHTPDSSRYWIASSYESRLAANQEPENVDKEFLRLWYIAHCDPYADVPLPDAPTDMIIELSRRYIQLYEMITGQTFKYPTHVIPVQQQLTDDLQPLIRAHQAKAAKYITTNIC